MSGTWWGPQMDHAWTMVTHLNRRHGMIYGLKYKTSSLHLACPHTHHTNTCTYNTITHVCMHGPTLNGTEVHNIITLFCFTYLFSAYLHIHRQFLLLLRKCVEDL